MGQATIYLDDDSERRLKSAAAAAGMPVSRWVAKLLQERRLTEWPESMRALAGAWQDLPEQEQLREGLATNVPREPF